MCSQQHTSSESTHSKQTFTYLMGTEKIRENMERVLLVNSTESEEIGL